MGTSWASIQCPVAERNAKEWLDDTISDCFSLPYPSFIGGTQC